ncbi:MAG: hypothetical protein QXI58_00195 [Candidatus Micrarchaeia archaeon]
MVKYYASNLMCPFRFHNYHLYSKRKIKSKGYDSRFWGEVIELYFYRKLVEKYGDRVKKNYKVIWNNVIGKIDLYVPFQEVWECKFSSFGTPQEIIETYLPQLVFYMLATRSEKGVLVVANPSYDDPFIKVIDKHDVDFKQQYDYIREVIDLKKAYKKPSKLACYFCPITNCEFNPNK